MRDFGYTGSASKSGCCPSCFSVACRAHALSLILRREVGLLGRPSKEPGSGGNLYPYVRPVGSLGSAFAGGEGEAAFAAGNSVGELVCLGGSERACVRGTCRLSANFAAADLVGFVFCVVHGRPVLFWISRSRVDEHTARELPRV